MKTLTVLRTTHCFPNVGVKLLNRMGGGRGNREGGQRIIATKDENLRQKRKTKRKYQTPMNSDIFNNLNPLVCGWKCLNSVYYCS